MKSDFAPRNSPAPEDSSTPSRWLWPLLAGCVLTVLLGISIRSRDDDPAAAMARSNSASEEVGAASAPFRARGFAHSSGAVPAPTAEETVANKVSQFARSRRELVRAIARRLQKDVPSEVEKFFEAVEAGHWEGIEAQFNAMA